MAPAGHCYRHFDCFVHASQAHLYIFSLALELTLYTYLRPGASGHLLKIAVLMFTYLLIQPFPYCYG